MESSENAEGVLAAGFLSGGLDSALYYLTITIAFVVIARVLLALASMIVRSRYNLIVAETSTAASSTTPAFLNVESAQRADILDKATAFDDRAHVSGITTQSAQPSSVELYSRMSRILSVLVAVISLATTIVGAVASIEIFDKVGQTVSAWGRFIELVRTHWIGATIVALVILIEIYKFVRSIRTPTQS